MTMIDRSARRRFLGAAMLAPTALMPLLASRVASAHGNAQHKPASNDAAAPEQKPWGIAGVRRAVNRTIRVRMDDHMRFEPALIRVREGETIRFVHRNAGAVLHEFVLGTPDELKAHAEWMRKFPNMEHDEPWMAHVPPGKTGEMIWHFNRAGSFAFACLIPGHFEAGMVGQVVVAAR